MNASSTDVADTLAHVVGTIGSPDRWVGWPGGWPGDIEAALVDAVFSARAVYRSPGGRGVFEKVETWRKGRMRDSFSLSALREEIDAVGPLGWARQFGNQQLSPGRSAAAPGGALKAATVRQAGCELVAQGVNVDTQFNTANAAAVKRALRAVPGIGYATANYFLMLLGLPGVKPDRMIHRFLVEAAGHRFTNADAERTISAAAQQLDVQPHELEHAIWSFESARARLRL